MFWLLHELKRSYCICVTERVLHGFNQFKLSVKKSLPKRNDRVWDVVLAGAKQVFIIHGIMIEPFICMSELEWSKSWYHSLSTSFLVCGLPKLKLWMKKNLDDSFDWSVFSGWNDVLRALFSRLTKSKFSLAAPAIHFHFHFHSFTNFSK